MRANCDTNGSSTSRDSAQIQATLWSKLLDKVYPAPSSPSTSRDSEDGAFSRFLVLDSYTAAKLAPPLTESLASGNLHTKVAKWDDNFCKRSLKSELSLI